MNKMNVFREIVFLELLFLTSSTLIARIEAANSENRCDTASYDLITTPCINCWQNRKVTCPAGSKKVTRLSGNRGCLYDVRVGERTMPARGCTHNCRQLTVVSKCCDGFWGQDCQSCPKNSLNQTCGGMGICSDGVDGNGTCTCQGNLAGSVCEKCSQPQFYGPTCQSTCACAYGTCDNGVSGSGACSCSNGYGGELCDKVLTECSSLSCHENAVCLNTTGKVQCQCMKGYTGDGSTCTEINPCISVGNTSCHANGQCVHTGPNQSTCKCNDGYAGDGYWCGPIDPCQTNNGACLANSTFCIYDGPNQSHCECRTGFENFTQHVGCDLIDVCGKYPKTTCDPLALCETILQNDVITVKCICPPGFVGRFNICYADLLTELDKANQTGTYKNRLNLAIAFFKVTYKELLFTPEPWTLFVPLDDGFPPSIRNNISSDALWKTRARSHIVAGSIHVNFTESSAKTMYPLLGSDYPIKALRPGSIDDQTDDDDAGYFADIKFGSTLNVKILVNAKWASNGLFYIIDTLLEPPDQQYFVSNVGVIDTIQQTPGLGGFMHLITKSFSFRRNLLTKSSYSLFAPSSEALAELSEEEYKYLNGAMGTESLDNILLYHLFTDPTSMLSLARVKRIRNVGVIPVNVSEADGIVTVGNEKAKITMSEMAVAGGQIFIYMIDKILIPDLVKPLVSNRCNDTIVKPVRGPCGDCRTKLCQSGGIEMETVASEKISVCYYEIEVDSGDGITRLSQKMGCSRMCYTNVTTFTCCAGFYGSECRSCPGPTHQTCNNHGTCSSGERGSGTCTCDDDFTGYDCSKCNNTNKYGPNCDQDCICNMGACKNTIDSHGECIPDTCADGWAGENCARSEVACKNGTKTCHQYASCVQLSNGTEICTCDAGYTGSGDFCFEFNPCENADWGGCDVNAHCLHLGSGRTACECPPNYSGDGYTCTANNPCSSSSKGGCSENGYCVFVGAGKSRCGCNHGYRGDGYVCDGINLCEQNNGYCSERAKCTSTGPGSRTCKCYDGYEGDGLTCLGNVLQEVALRSELSVIQKWVQKWISITRLFINLKGEFTCFLPSDDAWRISLYDDREFWFTEQHLPYLLNHHIVPRKIQSWSLHNYIGKEIQTNLATADIDVSNVTFDASDTKVSDNSIESLTLPTLGSPYAKLLVADLPVSNGGIIHIIDSVLFPPRDVVHDHPALSGFSKNTTGTKLETFTKFINLLVQTGFIDQIEETHMESPYTLFVAPDSSDNFPLENTTSEDLSRILRYHVVSGKMIRASNIKSGQHESTMEGPGYKVTLVQSHGGILVNGQTIAVPDIRTDSGIIHGLSDRLLVPMKSRCDLTTTKSVQSLCLPCSYPNRCPLSSRLIKKTHCLYGHVRAGEIKHTIGCAMKCSKDVPIPRCCSGFYGAECEPCPGGVGNVCYGVGQCSDGMKGNGSCNCENTKYDGVACESCAEGRYGNNCDQLCPCVNGICNGGKYGDGACHCHKGYRGALCDQPVDPNDTCGGLCHSAANCIPRVTGTEGECVCISGYEGDGQSCTAINSCESIETSGCSEHGICMYVSPGEHNCTCKKNYEGDGTYCSTIDRCVGPNRVQCGINAHCVSTGANRSNCLCDTNYEGDGKTCEPIDFCKKDNGGCSINANCLMTAPGERNCQCKDDYVGNGINCTGTIYSYIAGKPGFEWFTLMDSVRSQVPHTLNTFHPMVVFFPPQESITSLPEYILNSKDHATQLYLNHIVGCFYDEDFFGRNQVRTYTGDVLNIAKTDSGYIINSNISTIGDPVKLWSGQIYRIDKPILPNYFSQLNQSNTAKASSTKNPSGKNSSDTTSPEDQNTKMLKDRGFTWVSALFNKSGDLSLLQKEIHQPWTLFFPTDDAFNSLQPHEIRSIISSKEHASEYIRLHMVRESFLSPNDIHDYMFVNTMLGSSISSQCGPNRTGDVLLNAETMVTGFRVIPLATENGVRPAAVYIIDKVLQPVSLGGRCDNITNTTVKTECVLCSLSNEVQKCPENTKQISRSDCTVPLFHSTSVSITGCQLICAAFDIERECCDGYYGNSCSPCPGGASTPCAGNGVCHEGYDGYGNCECKEGFTGYACERCDSARFSRNCLPCKCTVHGACNEGIQGDGTCFCDSGWSGEKCDQKSSNSSICNPSCHRNGYCITVSGTCFCKPGFRGDGVSTCDFMDMCKVDNGGCSPYATCYIVREKVVCKCLPNFIGDGYVCDGYDPCTTSTSGCHSLARCVYVSANKSRCQCDEGYVGDGVSSCIRESSLPTTCASDNGGCSGNAICVDVKATKPGVYPSTSCKCMVGYVGDGMTCHGTVLQVISQSFEMRGFYRQLRGQPPRVRKKLDMVEFDFTVFVPVDLPGTRILPPYAINRHLAKGTYYYKDLQKLETLTMRSGDRLPVAKNNTNHLFINGVYMKSYDIVATNGVLHLVDSFITKKIIHMMTAATSTTTTSSASPTKTIIPGQMTSASTVKHGGPIDGGGVKPTITSTVISSGTLPSKTTITMSTTAITRPIRRTGPETVNERRRSVGIKVGVSVLVIALVLIIGGLIYWKRNRHSYVFRPFTRERLASTSDNAEEEIFSGVNNPAYDSTGFNTLDTDDVVLTEADIDTASAMKEAGYSFSFENPSAS